MRLEASHRYDADTETVFRLLTDRAFIERKYDALGARDVDITEFDERGGNPRITIHRVVTMDLPGFAKKVMQPTNTLVQIEDWAAPDVDGRRVCSYRVQVQGIPSTISGTLTLSPDGDGCRQDVRADVKVSIPLLGGRLEKFAVDNGRRTVDEEAAFTAARLSG